MINDQTEAILQVIGEILARDPDYPNHPTLLFARVARMYVGPSVFKYIGNSIYYRDENLSELTDPLLDLWEAQDGKPWKELEYVLQDGSFTIHYTYPDEINEEEDLFDRRDRVVAKHFGDKPIVYPPPPDDDDDTFSL